jgi:hypothetical protein
MRSDFMNCGIEAMFELELEMLDRRIGDLELERNAAAKLQDPDALRVVDQKLETLWEEVRRLSRLEAKLDLADPEERSRIVGRPN